MQRPDIHICGLQSAPGVMLQALCCSYVMRAAWAWLGPTNALRRRNTAQRLFWLLIYPQICNPLVNCE